MSKLAESIVTKLLATSALTALVGASSDARVYPVIAPDGTDTPYVVYQEIGGIPDTTLGEASASGQRLVQFSCVSDDYDEAISVAAKLSAALDNATLAGGEVGLSVNPPRDGFAEGTDQYVRIVEATFFAPPDS